MSAYTSKQIFLFSIDLDEIIMNIDKLFFNTFSTVLGQWLCKVLSRQKRRASTFSNLKGFIT